MPHFQVVETERSELYSYFPPLHGFSKVSLLPLECGSLRNWGDQGHKIRLSIARGRALA